MKKINETQSSLSQESAKSLATVVDGIVSCYTDDERLSISPDEEGSGYEVEYVGKSSAWRTAVGFEDEPDNRKITVISVLSIAVPQDLRSQIAELVTRINCDKDDTESSYIAFDMDDGAVVLITSIHLKDGELTFSMFDQMLTSNLMITEDFTSVIMKVVYCGVKPSEAMRLYKDEKLAAKTLH